MELRMQHKYTEHTQNPEKSSRRGCRFVRSGQAEAMKTSMCAKRLEKLTVRLFYALLLLSLGVNKIGCGTLADNSTDVLSLEYFKRQINNDVTGVFKTWNSSIWHCMWQGVTCSKTHPGRVVALELGGLHLAGQISSSVGNLTFLRTLNLSTNHFSGQIPPLNHLRKIQILDLSSNSLTGAIPDTLTNCSSLTILDLNINSLSGEIPLKIGLLSNLSGLFLSVNNLTGNIPPTLGNISHIKVLGLAQNHLTGSIPQELGKLSNMRKLLLGSNRLSGIVPQSIFNLSSLQVLSLEINMLGKTLPHDIGIGLPSIQLFSLNRNMFEGEIPYSIGNASNLQVFDLSYNHFIGEIPSSFGKLGYLVDLALENNKLQAKDMKSWEFLSALRNCSFLKYLSLNNNQLEGVIPNSIGNLPTSLQILLLGWNKLSGIVPPSIGNLRGLTRLGLAANKHSGTIEGWIGNLTNLQVVNLNGNSFNGPIPSSIGKLTRLTIFSLLRNSFEGSIPSTLGNLTHLSKLDFRVNNLTGTIPKEVFSVSTMVECSLSFNHLEGPIPSDFTKLQQLIKLDLSLNNLTGEIPYSLGQCEQLQTLDMNRNYLTGSIPLSFKNLKSLSMLDLSYNNLSGTVPVILCDLASLTQLDISYNNFQEEMPKNGVCSNATAVSLAGNSRLCGGAMNLRLPMCPSSPAVSQRRKRVYYWIKILVPIFGFMSIILLAYFLLLERKRPKGRYLSSTSLGENFPKVSYKDLAQATRDFSESNLIGKGSYGTVYRGKLNESKIEVAVKVFDHEMHGAERSFMSECEALRSIQHRNLLPIITACSTVDSQGNVFKALIYEFMPNGNLDTWIHRPQEQGEATKCLNLTQRINIATNIADALDYLHHDCGRPTVHRDLKPCNILLDDDMNALLGDFGIARFYPDSLSPSISTSSIGVKGTIGYIAPEYAGGGRASTFGDVYSFGIVVLEMITGKRPTDPMFKDGIDIVSFVESNFPRQIFDAIDAHIIEECKNTSQESTVPENEVHQCLVSLVQIALSCSRPLPNERANMKQVARKMQSIRASHLGWNTKSN
ncbi:receptor kinase-like protein Xa21 [Oryza glaberrima]|uniref:receptor kinase-like protein Xa21 n=1 Tax=Oryza glaberrima TaxID=4538 RepID=UPI00224C3D90|nr:receptor kinase-like protein Xa21 [Oryza glaberrima]